MKKKKPFTCILKHVSIETFSKILEKTAPIIVKKYVYLGYTYVFICKWFETFKSHPLKKFLKKAFLKFVC